MRCGTTCRYTNASWEWKTWKEPCGPWTRWSSTNDGPSALRTRRRRLCTRGTRAARPLRPLHILQLNTQQFHTFTQFHYCTTFSYFFHNFTLLSQFHTFITISHFYHNLTIFHKSTTYVEAMLLYTLDNFWYLTDRHTHIFTCSYTYLLQHPQNKTLTTPLLLNLPKHNFKHNLPSCNTINLINFKYQYNTFQLNTYEHNRYLQLAIHLDFR